MWDSLQFSKSPMWGVGAKAGPADNAAQVKIFRPPYPSAKQVVGVDRQRPSTWLSVPARQDLVSFGRRQRVLGRVTSRRSALAGFAEVP